MIHFVGAGPGAPDLITIRGQKLLAKAEPRNLRSRGEVFHRHHHAIPGAAGANPEPPQANPIEPH